MPAIISALEWRYAAKQFDPERPASEADIETIKKAVRLSASSSGLQPYRIVVVNDPDVKEKLRAAAYNQAQLTTASHIFVFAAKLDVSPEYVDDFMKLTAKTRGIPLASVERYGQSIKNTLAAKEASAMHEWTSRQAYIALGTLLATAAELKVDACPMEGFEPAKFDEILGLTEKGLSAVVIASVGYRSAEDKIQHFAKVRWPLEELFL